MTRLASKILNCKACGHEWIKRKDDPPQCPKCKSPYWKTGRIRETLAERNAKAAERRLREAQELLVKAGQLVPADAQRVIPGTSVKSVELSEIMSIPCGDAQDFEKCLESMGEGNRVTITGRLAELATENSFVARADGWSMSNEDRPDSISNGDKVLMIPFNEYSGDLYAGLVVLALIRSKSGAMTCTLKEYCGRKLKARNPKFKGVEFGPDVQEATILAICAGVVEKVFVQ